MRCLVLMFLLIAGNVLAQGPVLTIDNLLKEKDSLKITICIENSGNHPTVIYRPDMKDICYNVFFIKFIDVKTKVEHLIFPCRNILDLESFTLDSSNSIYLKSNDSFRMDIKFSLKDAMPFLRKGRTYKLGMGLNLKQTPFLTNLKYVCKNDLISNLVGWRK